MTVAQIMARAGYSGDAERMAWFREIATAQVALIMSNDGGLNGDPAEPIWSATKMTEIGDEVLRHGVTLQTALACFAPAPAT